MLKVAIIVPCIEQKGPVKVVQALVNVLSDIKELQVKVFCFDNYPDNSMYFKVPVEQIKPFRFSFEAFDVIHTNGIRPDFLAFINRKKIRYHVSTIHNFVYHDLYFTYNKAISFVFGYLWIKFWKRADRIVCVSERLKDYYSEKLSSSVLSVIHNGIAEEDCSVPADNHILTMINDLKSKGLKILGTNGVLNRRKGVDQILHLLSYDKRLALVVIGEGKESGKLNRLAGKLDVTDRCLFCGFMSNASDYCRYFDIYVAPSRSEGFGLSLVEAVRSRIPVICSDIDVFKELFSDEEVTFFKSDDHQSLCDALSVSILAGQDKTELAFRRYQKEYTDRLMAQRYYDLYKSVI